MGIYVIWVEDAGPEDEPADVDIFFEGVGVLRDLKCHTDMFPL